MRKTNKTLLREIDVLLSTNPKEGVEKELQKIKTELEGRVSRGMLWSNDRHIESLSILKRIISQ